MLKLFITISFLWCIGCVWMGGIVLTIPCMALILWVLITQRAHVQQLRFYANHTENIYIYSEHQDDHTVRTRANNARAMLLESGNKLGVHVLEIYYAMGGNCNETWEEFCARRDDIVRQDRQKRHEWLLRQSDNFYKTYVLKQV